MTLSLHAQASAVDLMATQARQRGNIKMKPAQWEMLDPRLCAAARTLMLLNAARNRPGVAEFIAEIEGGA
jgi:hypothetical protein